MELGSGRARSIIAAVLPGLLLAASLGALVPVTAQFASHAMTPAARLQGEYRPMGTFTPGALAPFPCQQTVPAHCYGPDQLRVAYDVQRVLDGGVTGAGRTIAIIGAFQSPTVASDLMAFDAIWRLPPPARFSVFFPDGATPFNPSDPVQIGWALEAATDVEWAHAIAPGAAIVLVMARSESDVDLLRAVRYVVDHRLADVISQSFSEAEQCAAPGVLAMQHEVYERALDRGMTVLASSADQGATQPSCDGSSLLHERAVATPASDPDVTAVGGTVLAADGSTGDYIGEQAWPGSGGGFSKFFRRPGYQAAADIGSNRRGVPDVAYDGGVGVLVVWSLLAPPGRIGLGVVGGTSIGPPQWAGVVALADQRGGRRIGSLNGVLYRLAKRHPAPAFHDVTGGSNSFGGVAGFAATRGWDPVTGLGTPDVAVLLQHLSQRDTD